MKILVTGCRGQLGQELYRQIEARKQAREEFHLLATDVDTLDITDAIQVENMVKREKPDVIINTAAYTKVDACETDEQTAFRVNALGARNLAVAAYNIGAKILQVSTDYVFDGTGNTPLREYDPVNPQSVYGKSKALGEQLVMTTNPRHFILRTAWLYGEGPNFVRTILKLAAERDELKVVDDQVGTPTSTVDLARCILDLIQTEHYGIYHGTCQGECTWYQFAKRILALKGIKTIVKPVSTEELDLAAKRPAYSVLENFMLDMVGLDRFRRWEKALAEYLNMN